MICIVSSAPAMGIPRRLLQQGKMRKKLCYSGEITPNRPEKMETGSKGSSARAARPVMLTSRSSGRVWAIFSLSALRSLLLLFNGILVLLLLPFRRRTIVVTAEGEEEAAPVERRGGEEKKEAVVVRVPVAMMLRRPRVPEAAARRAMAIRRIKAREEGDDGKSIRDFALFSTSRGDTLFTQSWTSVSIRTRGLVVLLHGLNEHSGRYNQFAEQLNVHGLKVYAMDWIGALSSVFSSYERTKPL